MREKFPIFYVRFSHECYANFISSDKKEKAKEKYEENEEEEEEEEKQEKKRT